MSAWQTRIAAVLVGALGLGGCYDQHAESNRSSATEVGRITGVQVLERIDLSDPTRQAGPPAVRFVRDHWVVAWTTVGGPEETQGDFRLASASIDANLIAVRTSRPLNDFWSPSLSIDAHGRVGALNVSRHCDHRVFEPGLQASSERFDIHCPDDAPAAAAAPIDGSDAWLVAYVSGDTTASIMVGRYEPTSSAWTVLPVTLGQRVESERLHVFAHDSDAVVLWGDEAGATLRSLANMAQVSGAAAGALGRAVHIAAGTGMDGGYATAQLHDHTLAFGMDGERLWAVTLAGVSTPIEHDIALSGIADRPPGAAAAEPLDAVGVCYATGPGPYGGADAPASDGVSFALLNVGGALILPPSVIADEIENVGGCAVAWSGEEFLVVYWHIAFSDRAEGPFISQVRGRRVKVLRE